MDVIDYEGYGWGFYPESESGECPEEGEEKSTTLPVTSVETNTSSIPTTLETSPVVTSAELIVNREGFQALVASSLLFCRKVESGWASSQRTYWELRLALELLGLYEVESPERLKKWRQFFFEEKLHHSFKNEGFTQLKEELFGTSNR